MLLLLVVLIRGSVGGVELRFRLLDGWLVKTGAGVSDGRWLLKAVSTCYFSDLICSFTFHHSSFKVMLLATYIPDLTMAGLALLCN